MDAKVSGLRTHICCRRGVLAAVTHVGLANVHHRSIGRLNVSGRSLEDKIIALDVDKPIGKGFNYRALETTGYSGVNGDKLLHLVGLTGVDRKSHAELYLVNNKPSVSRTTGEILDQNQVGANSTIELFKVYPEGGKMQHLQTFASRHIATPNNIAPKGDGSFYITNDHGLNKVGKAHDTSPLLKNGDVVYCQKDGCAQVDAGHAFPNGLAFGSDGLLYVPSSASGDLRVYEATSNGGIRKVATVKIPYPLDNLSLDGNGDLWVPGLPDIKRTLGAFENPLGPAPPSTVFRVHKKANGKYEVDKVLEDSEGQVLPATTTAIHDAKTGRIFLSSVISPFITVCDPKALPKPDEGSDARATLHGEL